MSVCNNIFDPYDSIVQKTIRKHIPLKVDWELTYRCNLSCVHCYQAAPDSRKELTFAQCCSALDQLADAGCLFITLTGGEVMLRDDFFDIAGYARKKDFAIRIFTNGTLVDRDRADRISCLHPLSVEISVYAADAAGHDAISGSPGSFEKTIAAFGLLRSRGVHTVLKTTFLRQNIGSFDALRKLSGELGAAFVFSFTVIPAVDSKRDVTQYRISRRQLEELILRRDWMVGDIEAGGVHVFEPLCSAGFNSFYISPYGEVFPCVTLRQHCGNISEEPLSGIWEHKVFRRLRAITLNDLPKCASCGLSYYCDRCAGLAWMEAGDMLGVSTNDCTLAAVRRKAVMQKKREAVADAEKKETVH